MVGRIIAHLSRVQFARFSTTFVLIFDATVQEFRPFFYDFNFMFTVQQASPTKQRDLTRDLKPGEL